jgi:hypothetical protein
MIDPTDEPNAGRLRTGSHQNGEPIEDRPRTADAASGAIPQPPSGAVLQPPTPSASAGRRWFLAQLLSEFRLTARMYFDPRYRVSRTAQLLMPTVLGLFALNYFTFSIWFDIPVVSPVLERLVCVLLGIFLYKIMTRELSRYREVLDYLARYGPG